MNLLVLSDIHGEFHADHGASFIASLPEADVVCVAGDAGVYEGGSLGNVLRHLSAKYKDVVYTTGNHEFYHSIAPDTDKAIDEFCLSLGNVHRLNHSAVTIEGQRFIGGTLWFPRPNYDKQHLRNNMADFSVIKKFEPWVYEQNDSDVRFISHQVGPNDIVLTHMIPSYSLITPFWRNNPLNIFFACEFPKEVAGMPKLWIFGHTHDSVDTQLYSGNKKMRTRFLCNPFGYVGHRTNPKFNDSLVIEV